MNRAITTHRGFGVVLAVLATLVFVIAPVSRADAVTTWINGDRVSFTPGDAYAFLGDRERVTCTWRAYVTIVKEGDHIYVRDDCADGIAAVGLVQWVGSGGSDERRYCVNRHGNGTIAHCNLDWPEGGSTIKTFVAGLETPSPVEGQWQWGTYVPIYD